MFILSRSHDLLPHPYANDVELPGHAVRAQGMEWISAAAGGARWVTSSAPAFLAAFLAAPAALDASFAARLSRRARYQPGASQGRVKILELGIIGAD